MNRKQLDSFKQTLASLQELNRGGYDWREDSKKRNAEKNALRAERESIRQGLNQEIANITSAGGYNTTTTGVDGKETTTKTTVDISNKNAVRKAAIDRLQQNKEFVDRANKAGMTVGKYTGTGSGGGLTYRHDTDKAGIDASNASRDRLYDASGNPRIPDFENRTYDRTTGKETVPMVGQGSGGPLDSSTPPLLANPAIDTSTKNNNGTVDDSPRYSELQKQTAQANQDRIDRAQAERESQSFANRPRLNGGRGYIDPNSPGERIKRREAISDPNSPTYDPTSDEFDVGSLDRRQEKLNRQDEELRAKLRATSASAQTQFVSAEEKLKSMTSAEILRRKQQTGRFGRPLPNGVERSTSDQDRPGGYSR